MILVGATEALLYPWVGPQTLHHPLELQRDLTLALGRSSEGEELHGIVRPVGVVEVDFQGSQGSDDAGERVNGVVEDEGLVLFTGLQVEASTVNDLHLFHDSALAGVAGAEKQKLDLASLPLAF